MKQDGVAIIGAGYAGMAAAVELAARGQPVTIFEASRTLGGRARAVNAANGHGYLVDNGQHILIGAYRETLRLMQIVGAAPDELLLRQPLHLEYPGAMRLAAPRLPAPLHLAAALLAARGLSWAEKRAAIRFMQALQRQRFRLADDCTVSNLLELHRQPARLREYLWEALCVAALNTTAEAASAQVFLHVLRDTLAAGARDSDLLLPRVDLTTLFPAPAAAYVTANGGRLLSATPIRRITRDEAGYTLHGKEACLGTFCTVIIAVAPHHLAPLIEGLPHLDDLRASLGALRYEPIVTCYLAYPAATRLPRAMLGQTGGIAQWLFDRGQLGGPAGLLAAIISARGRHLELANDELAARLHAEIAALQADLPPPHWTQVITEKRATFSCTPALARPATTTALSGLLLAGDYIASDYPGTLESAIRSGVAAAKRII